MNNSLPVDRKNALKILLLGESRTGKTSIARRFLGQDFTPEYHETIGVNISYIEYTDPEDNNFVITFWDLAGSEKFKAMRRVYFDGAYGVFLVWDVSRPETKDDLTHWFKGLKEERMKDLSVAILANKVDLKEEDAEYPKLADELEEELGLWSAVDFQTSALTGEGIYDALNWLSREGMFHHRKKRDLLDSVFQPSNYSVILFKMGDDEIDVMFKDKIHLYHISENELYAYLTTLGIKITFVTGQGESYSTGISNLIEEKDEGNRNRLLIYSFRLRDNEVKDKRLRENYLQFVLVIPKQYYDHFVSFRKVEPILEEYFNQFGNVAEITYQDLIECRDKVINWFKQQAEI